MLCVTKCDICEKIYFHSNFFMQIRHKFVIIHDFLKIVMLVALNRHLYSQKSKDISTCQKVLRNRHYFSGPNSQKRQKPMLHAYSRYMRPQNCQKFVIQARIHFNKFLSQYKSAKNNSILTKKNHNILTKKT